MAKIKLKDRINAVVRERENADKQAFLDMDDDERLYMLHSDFSRISREIRATRRWLFVILLFSFIALTQIANFFIQ